MGRAEGEETEVSGMRSDESGEKVWQGGGLDLLGGVVSGLNCTIIARAGLTGLGFYASDVKTFYARFLQEASSEGFLVETNNLTRDLVLLKF